MRIPLALVFLAMVLSGAQLPLPYSVAVVAGGNNIGDGGLATSASLMDAEGIAIDGQGNIYVADAGDNRVRTIGSTGTISTLAGTTTSIGLTSPYGLTVDARGNVYIADLGNNRILKIAPGGQASTVLANLKSPRNVLADGAGNIYFSEFGAHRVQRLAPDGSVTLIAGTGVAGVTGDGGAANAAQLSYPAGLALDAFGNLYIADSGNSRIRKVSAGKISTVSAGGLSAPTAVAADAFGNLFVADAGDQRIRKLTPAGTITTIPVAARDLALDGGGNLVVADVAHVYRVLVSGAITTIAGDGGYLFRGDGGPAASARLNAPSGVALDGSGNLWIADSGNGRIRMVSGASGTINTVAGGAGQINSPAEIEFDSSGNLAIADPAGYRIRELLTPQEYVVTLAGSGTPGNLGDGFPAAATPLSIPSGVAVGRNGIVYLSDTGNHRVRRLLSGVLVTVAGNGLAGFNGDGPGLGVSLSSPSGICVDGAGNLWIADTGNNRVRELTPDGNVRTVVGPDQLSGPRGVAVDGAGNLWIADTGNHRVVAVPAGGGPVVVASQLESPWSLAIDPVAGTVYVADAGSNLVVALSPGPQALTELPTPVTVVNAATLSAGPVAPGSLISIFGAGLAAAEVLFDGQPALQLLTQDTQINAQVPLMATGAIEVLTGGAVLLNTTLAITPCAPGIFTGPGGSGPVLASNADGTVNTNMSPAAGGSAMTFYATGIGQGAVSVTVGGVNAAVLYAGDAPLLVGVSQINAQVPVGIGPGAVPLVLFAGGVASQAGVVVFVQ